MFCWQFCLPCMNQTDELRTLLSYQINVQRSGYLTPRPFTKARAAASEFHVFRRTCCTDAATGADDVLTRGEHS